ncbi:hypothetical protein BURPS406E_H0769 [Burkholderia pseudomallei 406e]|uniref:Uncharacterized protein n=3 Tax=pseudomallei group TaxID=111527 RepID=A2S2B8_BURM9|nr:hypothetical protein BMASAVP1_A1818 [Burkholderia mallei SAVP1]ABN01539.1 hypothetical protein BMA10229_A0078 [Burkholderia mallei NCTC 10229]ABN81392.1 hypothetical protein BURPS668_2173 [Burkholderia pseudomallei 668]ABN90995.1 hypothetical protein BURPS1106A_2210 [Burkholderia pseudomallei 1106a]ABO06418.1 hypothetical protein BMA10247_1089 [Burkholderia mallei NCTC 10247]ACQ98179.1 conserved hypothetical protein [Burkholderia pseudomallei MSHR346]AFR16125.1 hypothetical protein BPC006_
MCVYCLQKSPGPAGCAVGRTGRVNGAGHFAINAKGSSRGC